MVESKTATSPSSRVGTSRRGLSGSELAGIAAEEVRAWRDSNGDALLASAIFTFCAYGDSGCS